MFPHKISALAIVACLAVANAAANSTCYYPNGLDSGGGACNANADVSVCCGPTFICLSNGLCKPGPDTTKNMKYPFYRSACTDQTFNSTSCPKFCIGPPYPDNKGKGVKSCGNNKYCCGRSGDCCTDEANIFTLPEAEVGMTILASSSFVTDSADSTGSLESVKHSNALAVGLGVGLGVGGFLLLALGVLYMLKRRARAKRHAGYEKKEEVSEMDGSFSTELPDTSPEPAPTKVGYSAPVGGVVHEIGEGGAGPSIPPQELEARPRYDWEPRNEPEPRDGGFRPEDHDRHAL